MYKINWIIELSILVIIEEKKINFVVKGKFGFEFYKLVKFII